MGMWDKFYDDSGASPLSVGELLAGSMLPIVGPIGVIAKKEYQKKKNKQKWFSENAAFYGDKDYSPDTQSGRVAQRMLERTGGEMTIPGIMASTAIAREAKDPSNMGNFGNIAMSAASDIAKTRPDLALKLATMAHKTVQTPWKPSEGQEGLKPINFTKNGEVKSVYTIEDGKALVADGWTYTGVADQEKKWEVRQGAELGMQGDAAKDYFKVRFGSDGKPMDVQKLDNAPKVNVGGTSLISPPDLSNTIIGLGNSYKSMMEMTRIKNGLVDVLDKNPTGGVQGWSGFITRTVGKVLNLAQFVSGLGPEEKAVMDRYTGSITQYAKQYFPTADEAQANSLVIQLAYSIARLNNMGTAGGGRGITDADMEFALQQLGSGATPQDMKQVVERIYSDSVSRFNDDYTIAEANLGVAGQKMPDSFKGFRDTINAGVQAKAPRQSKDWGNVTELPKDLAVGDIVNGHTYLGGPVNQDKSWR